MINKSMFDLEEMAFGWTARKELAIRLIIRQPFYNCGRRFKSSSAV